MAGIYIHIPFCKVKCHYCDFHFSTQTKQVDQMMNAMLHELEIRKNYLQDEPIETIYFGGGTPSFVSPHFLSSLIQKIKTDFKVVNNLEISVECNPDDINPACLNAYKKSGVNRFSMGVQSFDDDVLQFMNRAHSSAEIFKSIELAKAHGFTNITVDLIYGIPNKDLHYWKRQLDAFLKLDVPHLSSYCLTIESKTVFGNLEKKGKLIAADDESSIEQFQHLIDFMSEHGYEQYEISNFSKPHYLSKHNSNYWLDQKYLGIGPSAHSYNGRERSWNIRNNTEYIHLIHANKSFYETEILSKAEKCNDYILTRLRTKWGINLSDLKFIGDDALSQIKNKLEKYCAQNLIKQTDNIYILTDKGKYRADGIAADLFI